MSTTGDQSCENRSELEATAYHEALPVCRLSLSGNSHSYSRWASRFGQRASFCG